MQNTVCCGSDKGTKTTIAFSHAKQRAKPIKNIVTFRVEGNRERGRPRGRWEDQANEDMHYKKLKSKTHLPDKREEENPVCRRLTFEKKRKMKKKKEKEEIVLLIISVIF